MIVKPGTVTITAEQVLIERFEFKDVVMSDATQEAIAWAHQRLDEDVTAGAAATPHEEPR